jgi:threonine dehydratase
MRHGMTAAGRYLQFRLRMPDHPGSLAAVLALLAKADVNVLEVEHLRTSSQLHLGEVEIGLQLETKGPEHCEGVLSALRAAGYPVRFH